MSDCTHDCSSCSQSCDQREQQSLVKPLHQGARVGKVIGVVSGKGGVGKSLVTSLLAVAMQKKGYRCAVLDADITGPSIPQAFGIHDKATGDGTVIYPVESKSGIQLMSINLLLETETDPVVWRGPVIGGAVQQFWTDVAWKDVDCMFVDMPPGTGDVALTVFQNLPIDGIVVVTSPQQIVEMIVEKAVKMANMMDVPVVGLVENMSYFACPNCGNKHYIFGDSQIDTLCNNYGIDTTAKLPIDPDFAHLCDQGRIEDANTDLVDDLANKIVYLAQD